VAWTSGVAGFFKKLWGVRQPAPSRVVRSGERVRRVSAAEMTRCLFCGRTASVRSLEAAMQLDCSACGACEVTAEAMGLLRADENLRKAVFRQVRRHLETGVERPLVNLELIRSLKGR